MIRREGHPPRAEITPSLSVSDLDASVRFYSERFGMTMTLDYEEDGARVWCELAHGDSRLWLFSTEFPGWEKRQMTGLIYMFVDNPEAIHEKTPPELVEWGPEDMPYGLREVAVRDPDGYIVVAACDI